MIKVLACGICGGDYKMAKKNPAKKHPQPGRSPTIPGHEYVGEVFQSQTKELPEGMIVAVVPNNARCGVCENCRKNFHVCLNWPRRTAENGGGYSQYALVEPRQCIPVPEGLSPTHAAMAEPLACCLHSFQKTAPRPGETVIIMGGGANGLLFVQVARQSGASYVLLLDDIQERLDMALKLGADAAINPEKQDPLRVSNLLHSGADIVVVNRGRSEFIEAAVKLCNYGGRVLSYGVLPAGDFPKIDFNELWKKEICLIGSRSFGKTFAPALALLGARRINVEPFISTITLDDLPDRLVNPRGAIKQVICPNN